MIVVDPETTLDTLRTSSPVPCCPACGIPVERSEMGAPGNEQVTIVPLVGDKLTQGALAQSWKLAREAAWLRDRVGELEDTLTEVSERLHRERAQRRGEDPSELWMPALVTSTPAPTRSYPEDRFLVDYQEPEPANEQWAPPLLDDTVQIPHPNRLRTAGELAELYAQDDFEQDPNTGGFMLKTPWGTFAVIALRIGMALMASYCVVNLARVPSAGGWVFALVTAMSIGFLPRRWWRQLFQGYRES